MPVSLRVVLESLLRNCDGKRVYGRRTCARSRRGSPNGRARAEIPFVVARIMLQDMAGFPALNDFAAMRADAQAPEVRPDAHRAAGAGRSCRRSLGAGRSTCTTRRTRCASTWRSNSTRNAERYTLPEMGACRRSTTMRVVPPGNRHRAPGQSRVPVARRVGKRRRLLPRLRWSAPTRTSPWSTASASSAGAWAASRPKPACSDSPIYFLTPDVVGVHMTGKLQEGVTATDLVLTVTETAAQNQSGRQVRRVLRRRRSLAWRSTDRATVANMCPEYGATIGFFAVDDETLRYFRATGRSDEEVAALASYCKAQGMYGMPTFRPVRLLECRRDRSFQSRTDGRRTRSCPTSALLCPASKADSAR